MGVKYPQPPSVGGAGNVCALYVVIDMGGVVWPPVNAGGPRPLPRLRPRPCPPRLPKLWHPNWLGANGVGGGGWGRPCHPTPRSPLP
jgi:hypothetical protein